MSEETFSDILHTAAGAYYDVEDYDMREGILLLAANLLLPEVEDVHAMSVLRHAFAGTLTGWEK